MPKGQTRSLSEANPRKIRREKLQLLWLAIGLLALGIGLYVGVKSLISHNVADSKPVLLAYTDPAFGISFQYPASLRLQANHDVLGDGTQVLRLTFSNKEDASRQAGLTLIPFGASDVSEPLQSAIRRVISDNQGILPLHSCSFNVKAQGAECEEIGDQGGWIDAGHFPVGTTIFVRESNKLVGISYTQNSSLPFDAISDRILETLTF